MYREAGIGYALQVAIYSGDETIIQILLERGALVNAERGQI